MTSLLLILLQLQSILFINGYITLWNKTQESSYNFYSRTFQNQWIFFWLDTFLNICHQTAHFLWSRLVPQMIYWPHFVLICCCTPERRNKVPYSPAVTLLMCNHLLITIIFAKLIFFSWHKHWDDMVLQARWCCWLCKHRHWSTPSAERSQPFTSKKSSAELLKAHTFIVV